MSMLCRSGSKSYTNTVKLGQYYIATVLWCYGAVCGVSVRCGCAGAPVPAFRPPPPLFQKRIQYVNSRSPYPVVPNSNLSRFRTLDRQYTVRWAAPLSATVITVHCRAVGKRISNCVFHLSVTPWDGDASNGARGAEGHILILLYYQEIFLRRLSSPALGGTGDNQKRGDEGPHPRSWPRWPHRGARAGRVLPVPVRAGRDCPGGEARSNVAV